jgi:hypothetical protein
VEAGTLDAQLVLSAVPKGSDVAIIEGDPGRRHGLHGRRDAGQETERGDSTGKNLFTHKTHHYNKDNVSDAGKYYKDELDDLSSNRQ